jgi:hypothetical protein
MAYIKAHLFDTLEAANEAIELINAGEGIPVNPAAVTRTYTEPQENDGRIYIAADEVTEKYLGEPTEIELKFENIEL